MEGEGDLNPFPSIPLCPSTQLDTEHPFQQEGGMAAPGGAKNRIGPFVTFIDCLLGLAPLWGVHGQLKLLMTTSDPLQSSLAKV